MQTGKIYKTMIDFFESDDWHFQPMENAPVLSMEFSGKNGRWVCFAQAREEQHQFIFYSILPVNTPTEQISAVAEFITRVNYGMIIGNFELDYGDGEIRYKTSIDVEGDNLSFPLMKQIVYANVVIMDRYLSGLMRVMYGDAQPADEVERIESTFGTESDDDEENDTDYSDDELKFTVSLDGIDFSKLDDPDDDTTDKTED